MDDDERLDSIEARFNAYRVPERWQDSRQATENPNEMDEDEYAEWIRRGMWEKKHQREMEERRRKEHEAEERRAREKAQRREMRRLEEQERARRREKGQQAIQDAFASYQASWDRLASISNDDRILTYADIPWPISRTAPSDNDITMDSIAQFLLSEAHSVDKSKRRRIRDALFIYHPDRFEKWISMIKDDADREHVRETAGKVVRLLNLLADQYSS